MKTYTLSARERRRLSGDTGALAETVAADAYGFNRFVDADWYDGVSGDTYYEVKSALSQLSSGAAGRFRLWRTQHEQLVEYDRDESARYVFVVFDLDNREPRAVMTQRVPADVGRMIGARGGFYESGHNSKGEQYKMPIDAVFQ